MVLPRLQPDNNRGRTEVEPSSVSLERPALVNFSGQLGADALGLRPGYQFLRRDKMLGLALKIADPSVQVSITRESLSDRGTLGALVTMEYSNMIVDILSEEVIADTYGSLEKQRNDLENVQQQRNEQLLSIETSISLGRKFVQAGENVDKAKAEAEDAFQQEQDIRMEVVSEVIRNAINSSLKTEDLIVKPKRGWRNMFGLVNRKERFNSDAISRIRSDKKIAHALETFDSVPAMKSYIDGKVDVYMKNSHYTIDKIVEDLGLDNKVVENLKTTWEQVDVKDREMLVRLLVVEGISSEKSVQNFQSHLDGDKFANFEEFATKRKLLLLRASEGLDEVSSSQRVVDARKSREAKESNIDTSQKAWVEAKSNFEKTLNESLLRQDTEMQLSTLNDTKNDLQKVIGESASSLDAINGALKHLHGETTNLMSDSWRVILGDILPRLGYGTYSVNDMLSGVSFQNRPLNARNLVTVLRKLPALKNNITQMVQADPQWFSNRFMSVSLPAILGVETKTEAEEELVKKAGGRGYASVSILKTNLQ